jgi:hypothetical protein
MENEDTCAKETMQYENRIRGTIEPIDGTDDIYEQEVFVHAEH